METFQIDPAHARYLGLMERILAARSEGELLLVAADIRRDHDPVRALAEFGEAFAMQWTSVALNPMPENVWG